MTAGVAFKHQLRGRVRSIAGWYEMEQEKLLTLGGEQYLYLLGRGVVETSCCGTGGCYYAVVPGRVLAWHCRQDERGTPVSLVEPVRSQEFQALLSREIKAQEDVAQVCFL
ncbi:MAG: hypothetical protein AB1814_15740 [Thermodesulfobacteriota bacterium]